jgi:hypothetical protein
MNLRVFDGEVMLKLVNSPGLQKDDTLALQIPANKIKGSFQVITLKSFTFTASQTSKLILKTYFILPRSNKYI